MLPPPDGRWTENQGYSQAQEPVVSRQPHFALAPHIQRLLLRAQSTPPTANRISPEPFRRSSLATPTPPNTTSSFPNVELPINPAAGSLDNATFRSLCMEGGPVGQEPTQEHVPRAVQPGFHGPYRRAPYQSGHDTARGNAPASSSVTETHPRSDATLPSLHTMSMGLDTDETLDTTTSATSTAATSATYPAPPSTRSVSGSGSGGGPSKAPLPGPPPPLGRRSTFPAASRPECKHVGCPGSSLPQQYHDEFHRVGALVCSGQAPLSQLVFSFQSVRANLDALQVQHGHLTQLYDQMRRGHVQLQQHSQQLMATLQGVQAVLNQNGIIGIAAGSGEAGSDDTTGRNPKRARRS